MWVLFVVVKHFLHVKLTSPSGLELSLGFIRPTLQAPEQSPCIRLQDMAIILIIVGV